MPRVPVLLAFVALACPAAAQELLRIEGLQGRVETLGSSLRVELLTGLGPRDCPGPGLLEAGSMASARLYWPTRASLLTQGRAGLEWRGGAEAFLRVFELQHGELEVRRGPLELELPWGWHSSFETGAYRLRSMPGGALEIETIAGKAPHLWWSRGGLLRPRAGPACGERALLPPDWHTTSSATPETHAPWTEVSWPWGAAPERLRVTVEAQVEERTAAVAPEPLPAAMPAATEPQAQAPRLPPFEKALWRGHAREELELLGAVAIEGREDLALERSHKGCLTLRLRSDAPRSAWVLRQGSDLELLPGTLVVLDAQGALLASLGAIRSYPQPQGRPAPGSTGIMPRP